MRTVHRMLLHLHCRSTRFSTLTFKWLMYRDPRIRTYGRRTLHFQQLLVNTKRGLASLHTKFQGGRFNARSCSAQGVRGQTFGIYLTCSRLCCLEFPRTYDVMVACMTNDGKYVVTSASNTFIPQPVWGRISLVRCADGSFGQNDYMHWPQLFVDERGLRYLPAMPKTSDNSLDDGEMFTPMQKAHFVVTHSVTEVPLGVVDKYQRVKLQEVIHRLQVKVYEVLDEDDKDEHDELSWLWVTLTTSWERLAYPATRRDLVTAYCNVQRMYRTIRGYLTWYTDLCGPLNGRKPLVHDLVGAFTTDIAVATTLKKIGVPVWHMRGPRTFTDEHVILGWTDFTLPPESLNAPGVFSGGTLHECIAGPRHLRFIRSHAFNYQDIEKVPMPAKWKVFSAAPTTSSSRNTSNNRPHLSRPAMKARSTHEAGPSGEI